MTKPSRQEDFSREVYETIVGSKQRLCEFLESQALDKAFVQAQFREDGAFGNTLFNDVFIRLTRHAEERRTDPNGEDGQRMYDGLLELIRRGVPWFSSAAKILGCGRERPLEENPILSFHPWSVRLRSELVQAGDTFATTPLVKVKRELVLGGGRSIDVQADLQHLNSYLDNIVDGTAADGTEGVNRDLVSAFFFCHRLQLLWENQATQRDRLEKARREINKLIRRRPTGSRVISNALLQIAVTDSIPLLVKAARGEAVPSPAEPGWPRDPKAATVDSLPTVFRFATLPTAVLGDRPPVGLSSDENALVSRGFLREVMHTLRASSLGLEAGCVVGYPKFGDSSEDGRLVQRRVRYLIRAACVKNPQIENWFQVFGEAPPEHQKECAKMLFRAEETIGVSQGVSFTEDQAKCLLDIEEDSLFIREPSHSESDSCTNLNQVAKAVPAASKELRRDIDQRLFDGRFERAERTRCGKKRSEYLRLRVRRDEERSYLEEVLRGDIEADGTSGLRALVDSSFHPQFQVAEIGEFLKAKEFNPAVDPKKFQELSTWARDYYRAGIVSTKPLFDGKSSSEIQKEVMDGSHAPYQNHIPALHALLLDSVVWPQAREALQQLYRKFCKERDNPILKALWNGPKDELDGCNRSRALLYGYSCDPVLFGNEGIVGTAGQVVHANFSVGSSPCMTPLMAAARTVRDNEKGRLGCLEERLQVLRGGQSIDHHDGRGWRAIHHAFAFGNHSVAKLLLKAGARVGLVEGDKTTILIEALRSRHIAEVDDVAVSRLVNLAVTELRNLSAADQQSVLTLHDKHAPKVRCGDPLSALAVAVEAGPQYSLAPLQTVEQSLTGGKGVWGGNLDRFIKDRFSESRLGDFVALIENYDGFAQKLADNNGTLGKHVCKRLIDQIKKDNLVDISKKLEKLVRIKGVGAPDDVFHTLIQRLVAERIGHDLPITECVVSIVRDLLSQDGALDRIVHEKFGETAVRAAWRSGQQLVALLMADKLASTKSQIVDAAQFLATADRQQMTVAEVSRLVVEPTGMVRLKVPLRSGAEPQVHRLPADQTVSAAIKFPYGETEAQKWLDDFRADIAAGLERALQPTADGSNPLEFSSKQLMTARPYAFEKLLAHLYDKDATRCEDDPTPSESSAPPALAGRSS